MKVLGHLAYKFGQTPHLTDLEYATPVSARISSVAHATEDTEKVIRAISNICPEDLSREFHTIKVKGHYGNPITIIRLVLRGGPAAERLFNNIWGKLSSLDKAQFKNNAESHIDESGVLHIRVDKQTAFVGRVSIEEGEPIKVEITFKAWSRGQSILDLVKNRIETLP